MKIKICGITTREDAVLAIEAEADMLGFNFYPGSPRYITPEACAAIVKSLKGMTESIYTIGVFVNAPVAQILTTLDGTGLQVAQLSGDEPVADLAALGPRGFKAVRLPSAAGKAGLPDDSIQRYIDARKGVAPAFLLDALVKGSYGGTGKTANWGQACLLAAKYPFMLAGGLNVENIAEAVSRVRPWGVDVASGVESAPGRKDPLKLKQFIRNAREAEKQIVSKVDEIHQERI
jgi:phosphoribosylanthranilate isomerase